MLCPNCQHEVFVPKTPLVTVDIIIESEGGIVLIERRNPPHGWALPGGFVDYGETLEAAARREAFEETGLEVNSLRQLHTYSDPSRDQRFHTVSTVFVGRAEGKPLAGDDAGRAGIFRHDSLPPLVFDHGAILDAYFAHNGSAGKCPVQDPDR